MPTLAEGVKLRSAIFTGSAINRRTRSGDLARRLGVSQLAMR